MKEMGGDKDELAGESASNEAAAVVDQPITDGERGRGVESIERLKDSGQHEYRRKQTQGVTRDGIEKALNTVARHRGLDLGGLTEGGVSDCSGSVEYSESARGRWSAVVAKIWGRMEWGIAGDELAGTCNVCAVAEGALYRDWRNWDERDRGDPADDGVCGFGV